MLEFINSRRRMEGECEWMGGLRNEKMKENEMDERMMEINRRKRKRVEMRMRGMRRA